MVYSGSAGGKNRRYNHLGIDLCLVLCLALTLAGGLDEEEFDFAITKGNEMSTHRDRIDWQAQVSSCATTPARSAALYRRSASETVQYRVCCTAALNDDTLGRCNTSVKSIYVHIMYTCPDTEHQRQMSYEYGPVWDLSALFEDVDGDADHANGTHEGPRLSPEAHAEFLIATLNRMWPVVVPWLQLMQDTIPPAESREWVNVTDNHGQNCLDYAINYRMWHIVERLLMLGAVVVPSRWPGDYLIITAASDKAYSVVQMLFGRDANIRMPRILHDLTAGGQAMHTASQNLRWDVVEALCAAGVDGRLLGHASRSPLMMAARTDQWTTVALILDSVMEFVPPDLFVGYPAYTKSAWLCGHTNDHGDGDDSEEHVSSYGVHIDDRKPDDNNLVVLAALAGLWDLVCTLLAHFNADPDAVSYKASNRSLFELAAYTEKWTVCLRDLFPLVSHPNCRGFSMKDCELLQWVVRCEEWGLASRMVASGYVCVLGTHNIEECMRLYQDMMRSAIAADRWQLVYQMLQCGVTDDESFFSLGYNETALMYACRRFYSRAIVDRDHDDSDYSDDGDYSDDSSDDSDSDTGNYQAREDMDSAQEYDSGAEYDYGGEYDSDNGSWDGDV